MNVFSSVLVYWKESLSFLATLFAQTLLFQVSHAQGWPRGGISGARNIDVASSFICDLAFWLFWILIILTVVFVLIAAYLYLTSGGDAEKVKKATKLLTFAAVAVVVALIARGFPFIISSIFLTRLSRGAGC